MQVEKFKKYSQQVAMKYIIDLAREVDLSWGNSGHHQRIESLCEALRWCVEHPDPAVTKMSSYSRLLKPDMAIKDLLCFLVPFEREYTRGVVDHEFIPSEGDSYDKIEKFKGYSVQLVLDNIRSSFNVGSIFRTAECFGVDKVLVCGYTTTPSHEKTRKTSMGASELVSWEAYPSAYDAIQSLKNSGVHVVAVETVSSATSLANVEFPSNVAFLLGNERYGLSPDLLSLCDEIVKIPMLGVKNSLNVGVALGVCLGTLTLQKQR